MNKKINTSLLVLSVLFTAMPCIASAEENTVDQAAAATANSANESVSSENKLATKPTADKSLVKSSAGAATTVKLTSDAKERSGQQATSTKADTKIKAVEKTLSPEGYWVQFDEDKDAGRGMAQGVVHSYFAKNDDYGPKETLPMSIVVPLMDVSPAGKVERPLLYCKDCSNGSYNGFNYKGKGARLEGLVISSNMQKQNGTGSDTTSPVYSNGGVINPNDGKIYASEAQVQDSGKTLYAKASYIVWGKELGSKAAHWKRISKEDYLKIAADCGVDDKGEYINKDKSVTDKCTDYPVSKFGIKSPV